MAKQDALPYELPTVGEPTPQDETHRLRTIDPKTGNEIESEISGVASIHDVASEGAQDEAKASQDK